LVWALAAVESAAQAAAARITVLKVMGLLMEFSPQGQQSNLAPSWRQPIM
jgi:hypothetical protein